MIFLLPLLSWSQSYPYQRIEGSDTVVVMTKKQGEDINNIFRINKLTIDSLGNKTRFLLNKNLLYTNHILKQDSLLKESINMNITLDSILISESAQYRREITKETVSNQKINKIALTTWGILFILFMF
jgi:CO dehydrogenase nickel-insertion accessory protein CooC1